MIQLRGYVHNYEANFLKNQNAQKPTKKPTRLKLVADSKKDAQKEYTVTKAVWRKERKALDGMQCELVKDGVRCPKKADNSPHHRLGRKGKLLSNKQHFVALCRGCHIFCHENVQWARENHYIEYDHK